MKDSSTRRVKGDSMAAASTASAAGAAGAAAVKIGNAAKLSAAAAVSPASAAAAALVPGPSSQSKQAAKYSLGLYPCTDAPPLVIWVHKELGEV